jgi:predicted RNase H-like HicB family nuclease
MQKQKLGKSNFAVSAIGFGCISMTCVYNSPREFSVIIERDAEGYYVGMVPALRGCHSQANSLDELMIRIREAVEVSLEAQGDSLEPLDFVGVQTIRVAS